MPRWLRSVLSRLGRRRPVERWDAYARLDCTIRIRRRINGRVVRYYARWCPLTMEIDGWPDGAPRWLRDEVEEAIARIQDEVLAVEVWS